MNDNLRNPRNKRRNDSLMNYIMLGLVLVLVVFLVIYVVKAMMDFGNKDQNSKNNKVVMFETEKETNREISKETEKETNRETKKETEKETNRETNRETKKETEKETNRETKKETEKETKKETKKETTSESEDTTEKEYNINYDYSKRDSDPYAAIVTSEDIKGLPMKKIVDMVILGDIGYGLEREQILKGAGFDIDKVNDEVNKKLNQ